MEKVAVDTTFLIDLQNERRRRGRSRGAMAFLEGHRETEFFLPVVARGEYLEGFDDPGADEAREFIDGFQGLNVTAEVAAAYAGVARELRAAGKLIGSNDLWIGCVARTAGLAILTRNVAEFGRIPGLEVVDYSG